MRRRDARNGRGVKALTCDSAMTIKTLADA
jgi:hypothetical protein